jgi:hypothetical protein
MQAKQQKNQLENNNSEPAPTSTHQYTMKDE